MGWNHEGCHEIGRVAGERVLWKGDELRFCLVQCKGSMGHRGGGTKNTSLGIHPYRVRRSAQRECEGWGEKLAENIVEVSGKIKGEEPVKETEKEWVGKEVQGNLEETNVWEATLTFNIRYSSVWIYSSPSLEFSFLRTRPCLRMLPF